MSKLHNNVQIFALISDKLLVLFVHMLASCVELMQKLGCVNWKMNKCEMC